jgi:3-hydroxyisobutyrate dehydrogenase-like beta-hydroxyacid dehydrogenase
VARLAFLGLGAMGAPMAARLIEAGHAVTLWNRTRARAEAIDGAERVAVSPADAATGADAVITMLATPDVVREVLLGADGVATALAPGATVIDMSTIGPDHAVALAGDMPDGVAFIDVPVMGGVRDAVGGTLTLYFGSDEAAFARWGEVLAPLGRPLRLGPLGSGQAMKLVANSTLAGLMSLTGEALALGDRLGLDEGQVLAALLDSPIGPAVRRKLDKIESDRYTASFRLALMRKDMGLVTDAAGRREATIPLLEAAAGWMAKAEAAGHGDLDYSAVVAEIRGREPTA